MACKCINEVKESLQKHYEAKINIEKVTNVSLENTALMFGSGPATVELYSPVKIEYDYENRKGEIKHKKEKVTMSYKYCPFCGESYSESEE